METVRKFTPKEKLFVKYYLISWNSASASKKAGYKNVCSGLENLGKPWIRKYIAEQMEKLNKKLDMKAEDVIRQLCRIAMADPRDLFNDDGSIKPISEWDDNIAMTVSDVSVVAIDGSEAKIIKAKRNDRMKALEMLMRYHSLFKDISVNLNVDENTDVDEFNDKLDRIISAVQSGNK